MDQSVRFPRVPLHQGISPPAPKTVTAAAIQEHSIPNGVYRTSSFPSFAAPSGRSPCLLLLRGTRAVARSSPCPGARCRRQCGSGPPHDGGRDGRRGPPAGSCSGVTAKRFPSASAVQIDCRRGAAAAATAPGSRFPVPGGRTPWNGSECRSLRAAVPSEFRLGMEFCRSTTGSRSIGLRSGIATPLGPLQARRDPLRGEEAGRDRGDGDPVRGERDRERLAERVDGDLGGAVGRVVGFAAESTPGSDVDDPAAGTPADPVTATRRPRSRAW